MSVDGYLSPYQCAKLLGVSDDYIVGEIKDGRLPARERCYASGRKRYRVDPVAFAAYIDRYWPLKTVAKAS